MDFIKQRKIFIIIGILLILLIGWKIYDYRKFEDLNLDELVEANNNDNTKEIKKEENSGYSKDEESENEELIAVHITGEVKKVGVVRVKEGSRVEDIINAAGGLTENADLTNVNLAFVVEDGMKIRIPSCEDVDIDHENKEKTNDLDNSDNLDNLSDSKKLNTDNNSANNSENDYISSDNGRGVILSNESEINSSLSVNINTATQTELEELPGIGPSISSRIVDYRNNNGKFKKIEDIKNVTGIGENKFEKIKDFIKVK